MCGRGAGQKQNEETETMFCLFLKCMRAAGQKQNEKQEQEVSVSFETYLFGFGRM